ncbi:nucleotidyltransferase [Candidatus Magnetoovum chiemensis]|nr:nucleotidyltransferase [Candidatus Magnetoovum chiemensis]
MIDYSKGTTIDITLEGLTSEQIQELLPTNLIVLGYRGSIAHGMYVPSTDPASIDDKDLMGVFIGTLNTYLGLNRVEQKALFINEWDAVSYEIRKFISLLLKSNPNVLMLLWLDDEYIIYKNSLWDMLKSRRDIFVAKTAYRCFSGYAYGQLQKMTHFAYEGYMGQKRKKLVEEFGYDTKNAAHLIRLLRMGIEFLRDGHMYVKREDAAELIDIKKGMWTLEQVKKEAEKLFALSEEAYNESKLPAKPNYRKAEELLISMVETYHGITYAQK